jgi:hypothetical protein
MHSKGSVDEPMDQDFRRLANKVVLITENGSLKNSGDEITVELRKATFGYWIDRSGYKREMYPVTNCW